MGSQFAGPAGPVLVLVFARAPGWSRFSKRQNKSSIYVMLAKSAPVSLGNSQRRIWRHGYRQRIIVRCYCVCRCAGFFEIRLTYRKFCPFLRNSSMRFNKHMQAGYGTGPSPPETSLKPLCGRFNLQCLLHPPSLPPSLASPVCFLSLQLCLFQNGI